MYTLGMSRVMGVFAAKLGLKKKIQEVRPKLIHTQGIRADSLLASMKPDIPWVLTSRNYPYHDYPVKFGRIRGRLMAMRHIAVMKKCENVIACSKTNADLLRTHGVKTATIQNGVDDNLYHPLCTEDKAKLREHLGLDGDATVFISVGSLIHRKDMYTLIKAFLQTDTGEDSVLVILGDGPQITELEKLASGAQNVVLKGNVKNVGEFLQASDVFVSSSLSEGLPNTVLEAMACGLPCILSDIPSHRELFEDAGQKLYCPCGDRGALSNILGSVTVEDLTALGKESRKMVERRFSAQRMSNEYQEKYIHCVQGQEK